jgi:hypothetical protein
LNLLSQNYGYSYCQTACFQLYQAEIHGLSIKPPISLPLSLCQQAVSVYIIRKISQTYLGFGPDYTNRSYEKTSCSHCLNSKYMFHPAANLCSAIIAFYLAFIEFLITITLSLNMAAKTAFIQSVEFVRRAVSRIRPHISAAVVFIEKLLKNITVEAGVTS